MHNPNSAHGDKSNKTYKTKKTISVDNMHSRSVIVIIFSTISKTPLRLSSTMGIQYQIIQPHAEMYITVFNFENN